MAEKIQDSGFRESVLLRPLRIAGYAFRPQRVVLDKEEYCHVLNRRTGDAYLVEGPVRHTLRYDEEITGSVNDRLVIPENHFCVIENPVDRTNGSVSYGTREVRVGPQTFSLHPGENVETDVTPEYVLTKYDALLVKSVSVFDDHKTGDEYLVNGPRKYIPTKHEKVIEKRKARSLSDTDGVYVQDRDTGEVTLVKGPADYFLQPNEVFYKKHLTRDELEALGLKEQQSAQGVRVLTRQAANTSFLDDGSNALVLELEDNEIVLLYDGSETRVEQGPKTTFLGPYERPKVLNLSGGKPIKQSALKIALLKLGPDFIYDQIKVRTRDNAQLKINLTYKWRFTLGDKPKKAFDLQDFVGYAAETLSSEIRSVAAQYDFEDLHTNALDYINKRLFGDGKSRVFNENGLEIFGVDVTSIDPEDPKIAEKLHEAIKHNMDIYCNKLILKATLESERQKTEGERKIEEERSKLIDTKLENQRKQTIEDTKIKADAKRIQAESEAAALKIVNDATISAETQRVNSLISELAHEGGVRYLELQRVDAIKSAEKLIVVPTDSKIVLPYAKGFLGDELT